MEHVHTFADFSEHYVPLPDSMDHLLPDKGNKWIPGTLVEADAAPSEPIRKSNFNDHSKEMKAKPNASLFHSGLEH
jgi:hypothetical protein